MKWAIVAAVLGMGVLLMIPTASFVYESGGPDACARCHEMGTSVAKWKDSTHRGMTCAACHGDALTTNPQFHLTNALRLKDHVMGEVPDRALLRESDVLTMQGRCQKCHPGEFAAWQNGPHSANYTVLFTDKKHNSERHLMEDCLRCHGMHFDGSMRDLVTPMNQQGPWQLKREDLAQKPAIPCLSCHAVHTKGKPLAPHVRKAQLAKKETVMQPSLAFFDRRTQDSVPVALLPVPAVYDGARKVKVSPDPRQALCYQCHAPLSTGQVKSGDDRTPIGVHEGLSCLACHDKHRQTTRASCANCHPRLSNCGRDVETMDTSFASPNSKHNIHFVTCAECHPKGVPKKKTLTTTPTAD